MKKEQKDNYTIQKKDPQETLTVQKEDTLGVKKEEPLAVKRDEPLTTQKEEHSHKYKKNATRQLVVIGMLGAVTMILGLTGYGFIQLYIMKATILQVPTIIGALLEGPKVGAAVGLIFGGFSVYQNLVAPTVMSAFFLNPLVSVLPRILIGPFAYLVYKVVRINNQMIRLGIAAFAGSAFNTVTVLGMIYLLYAKEYAIEKHLAESDVFITLTGIATTYGIPEALVSAFIGAPVVYMVARSLKK